jgi:hypothetical protein
MATDMTSSLGVPVAAIKQKDGIGLLYLAKILGISEETITQFITCDPDAYLEVAQRFHNGNNTHADCAGFWQAANQLCCDYYKPEEIALLVSHGRDAVESFILALETPFHEESFVMYLLTTARSSTCCFKEEQQNAAI